MAATASVHLGAAVLGSVEIAFGDNRQRFAISRDRACRRFDNLSADFAAAFHRMGIDALHGDRIQS